MHMLASILGWTLGGMAQGALFLGLPAMLVTWCCLALGRRLRGERGVVFGALAGMIFASLPLLIVVLWFGSHFVRFGLPDFVSPEELMIFPVFGIAMAPPLLVGATLFFTWHRQLEKVVG
jgi:hypothetical protein